MKKIGIALILSIVILAAVYMIAYAATTAIFTTCQTLYDERAGWAKEAVVCHTVTVNWIHSPNRVACRSDGTRSITLYNGYTAKLSTLTCNPKTYTTDRAYSYSKVYIYKGSYNTDFSSIKCTFRASVIGSKSCDLQQAR